MIMLILCGLIVMIIVLTVAVNGILYTIRVEKSYPASGRVVTVNGADMHVLQSGDEGPVILMLHGASANAREFTWTLAPYLAGEHRILMPDRPGHGHSGRLSGAETLKVQAAQIAGMLARFVPDDKVVIVGHSFGAAIALRLVLDYPERVGGLVLLAPVSHDWGGGGQAWYNVCAAGAFTGLFFSWLAPIFGPARAHKGIDATFFPHKAPEDYYRKSAIGLLFRPKTFRANALDVNALRRELRGQQDRYPEIQVPVIVYSGEHDTVLSPRLHADRLHSQIGGLRLVQLARGGHMPHHVHGKAIASMVARLADVTRTKDQPRSAMLSR